RVATVEPLGEDHTVDFADEALQEVAAFVEGAAAEVLAVEPEQIEDAVRDRRGALLEELEARPPGVIERDDLAVEDGLAHDHPAERAHDRRVRLRQVLAAARAQRDPAVRDASDGAVAVILHLVDPVPARNTTRERGQHRRPYAIE